MRRVPIEQATAGLTLAKPVANAAGMVVLGEGAVLDDALIVRLDRMGVRAVYVEGDPEGDGVAVKTLAELERELDDRFRKVAGDPIQSRIREAVRRRVRSSHGKETAP
jgi:hypothetical protein